MNHSLTFHQVDPLLSLWEVSDPAACPEKSSSCSSSLELKCSFKGCQALPQPQDKVVYTDLGPKYMTGATLKALCSNGGESYSVLETYSSADLVMAVSDHPEYSPLYPDDSSWCPHQDCLPAVGLTRHADPQLAGRDCVEEEGYGWSAWCLGDPSLILWTGHNFSLSEDACQ